MAVPSSWPRLLRLMIAPTSTSITLSSRTSPSPSSSGMMVRVAARDPGVRAAREVDATHRFDGQRQGTAVVALHQPFETVTNPDHADAAHQRTNGGRANHAVDAWRGATAAQDPYALRISHKA